jgi:hypothetical protein
LTLSQVSIGGDYGYTTEYVNNNNSCIQRQSGDNLTLYSVRVACDGWSVDGDWGSGADHLVQVNRGVFQADYSGWFRVGNTPVTLQNAAFVNGYQSQAVDQYLDLIGAYRPPANLGACDHITLLWHASSGGDYSDTTKSAWTSKCTNVTFLPWYGSVPSYTQGSSAEQNSI